MLFHVSAGLDGFLGHYVLQDHVVGTVNRLSGDLVETILLASEPRRLGQTPADEAAE
jgi:hypothetical protein